MEVNNSPFAVRISEGTQVTIASDRPFSMNTKKCNVSTV